MLHFHGGAFVCNSSYFHSSYTRQWANILKEDRVIVFSVDYRLAPEHPAPKALLDGVAAIRYAAGSAGTFGFDPGRLAVSPRTSHAKGEAKHTGSNAHTTKRARSRARAAARTCASGRSSRWRSTAARTWSSSASRSRR